MLWQRGPRARRHQVVSGVLLDSTVEHEETVVAPNRRDAPGNGARRQSRRHQLTHVSFERLTIEALDVHAFASGEFRQSAQVARVALERVVGETPFRPEVVEVRVDHQPGYANIRGFEAA